MKFLDSSPIVSTTSSIITNFRQFPFELCPQLRNQLRAIAIRHIAGDLQKALLTIKRKEFIDARNRIDIPHGLFGLSLENFNGRLKENTVYIDVLQLVCKETLEKAKFCIVLDDLHDLVSRLFNGFENMKTGPIFKAISDSASLLKISETMTTDFKKNSDTLRKLRDKLNAFNVREKNAIAYMNSRVCEVQSKYVEAELVVDPIEFRYILSFHYRTTEQFKEMLCQTENELLNTLADIEWSRRREDIASNCGSSRQRIENDVLKSKLEEMIEKYEREYDYLDGQITYKKNSIQIMQGQYTDCLTKMQFFATEMVKLRKWEEVWNTKNSENVVEIVEKKTAKKRTRRSKKK